MKTQGSALQTESVSSAALQCIAQIPALETVSSDKFTDPGFWSWRQHVNIIHNPLFWFSIYVTAFCGFYSDGLGEREAQPSFQGSPGAERPGVIIVIVMHLPMSLFNAALPSQNGFVSAQHTTCSGQKGRHHRKAVAHQVFFLAAVLG